MTQDHTSGAQLDPRDAAMLGEHGPEHSDTLALDDFARRHIGPSAADVRHMLDAIGLSSLDELVDEAVPEAIRLAHSIEVSGEPRGERQALAELAELAASNVVRRSLIGMGYAACATPTVLLRNILENPGWYTQYTPYQAEIAQGRLEALLNFQTMVADLTGLPVANASLLDEATAVAEAMAMGLAIGRRKRSVFLVDQHAHPATIAVVRTRAEALGITIELTDLDAAGAIAGRTDALGVHIAWPDTRGHVRDLQAVTDAARAAGAISVVSADLLALVLLESPGTLGADICVGNTQRFGMPLGLGGPHAAFLATRPEHQRLIPGRIVGVSRDAAGQPAYRLAIQTREQHIRRERATSNICTAQALPAIVAAMYACYHGPRGLRRIAGRVHRHARALATALTASGWTLASDRFFDTITLTAGPLDADAVRARTDEAGINLRYFANGAIGIALDERTTADEVATLASLLGAAAPAPGQDAAGLASGVALQPLRDTPILHHPVFNDYHAEHEMLRYLYRLQQRDLSLTTSMIPLGSCTMKLNATSEMIPITWPGFADIHPYAPAEQWVGYRTLFDQLERWICDVTGFAAASLQPNAGSQGEYAGLMAIRAWHHAQGQPQRTRCLIPTSAHGTNPASAVVAGFEVVPVRCDDDGNIDLADLEARAAQHADRLGALMITYPSTHGVFEEGVREACAIVHRYGGQVYMDGANMNAQVGLCRPGDIGADVCHLNLHKTFCIPHGGGGPGMGPIGVAAHLAPYLPGNPVEVERDGGIAISGAPYGSGAILPISWMYIRMMGGEGLRLATQIAILNANYMARRLEGHYDILFRGHRGRVAHEFIIDLRPFKATAGVEVEDVAKRLMDYGFHAPTMSWPVPGSLMIEPTESESRAELDRFCDAMIGIREEIAAIEAGAMDAEDNPLRNAPHTATAVTGDAWPHPYSRELAAFPLPWIRTAKFWPAVARVDNGYGDRNLVCTCPTVDELAAE